MSVEHLRTLLTQAEAELATVVDVPAGPSYQSFTDRVVRPKPAPHVLGPAGSQWFDPLFGSPLWRVTDPATSGGSSLRVQSNAHAASWNSDGSACFVLNEGGAALVFRFDGQAVSAWTTGITSQIEPSFSYVVPQVIFGAVNHTIKSWRLDMGGSTDILNLDTRYLGLPLAGTYIGGFLNADQDVWAVFFGGAGQDQHVFVHHSVAGLLDVRADGWKIHSISLDRTGRFVLVYPAVDPTLGRLAPGVAQVYVWDTQGGGLGLIPQTVLSGGHDSVGYGLLVNADCCTKSAWDASQWQIRSLLTPNITSDLIPVVLTPKAVYLAEHSNWRAAQADARVPVVSASYRYGAGVDQSVYPWRPWDEEIIAVATDGSGTVWRFAHHQSIVGASPEFWAEPIVQVSPDGRHAIFTSNWGVAGGRQDVFLVGLQ